MSTPRTTEQHFPIMGSAGHLVVVGGPEGLVGAGIEQLDRLESLWSRFRPSSEISRLNQAGGAPCLVSGPTRLLVEAMLSAWELTGGRFDPTVGHALGQLGYDHSWPLLSPPIRLPHATPSVGPGGVALDLDRGMIQLPRGISLDPGGLGKGLAADIVATELMAAGADGVLVNVGGDLRVIGAAPHGDDDWLIAVEHPDHPEDAGHHLTHLALTGGGVATSTAARRHWSTRDGTPVHHLIDPATSLPATTTRRQVTVVAGCGWWAEALAKVAFLDGDLPDVQAGALVVERDGHTSAIGQLDRFARQTETVA